MALHETTIRIRYEETDRMGVAYYSNYFVWFEVARTELFRELDLPYAELEKEGIRLMVSDARCSYKSPVTYDDTIIVKTTISKAKNASIYFRYEIHSSGKLIATGETAHVFTNKSGRPIRIPQKVGEVLTGALA